MNKRSRQEKEQIRIWAVLILLVFFAVYGVIRGAVDLVKWFGGIVSLRPAQTEELENDIILPESGIGRDTAKIASLPLYGFWTEELEAVESLRVWSEDDVPLPDWWDPDSAELVWEDRSGEVSENVGDDQFTESGNMVAHPPEGIDPGGVDWNICSTIWGWDGHGAEVWELDLLARVFYIEFWGASPECCEAGCDAILNLWASGNYGRTLFEALSYYDPVYGYTYEVYPWIWDWNYDADGLAWCKDFCEERFINGPEWECVYFQLGGYHDPEWVSPLYEMDGVYFSAGSRW